MDVLTIHQVQCLGKTEAIDLKRRAHFTGEINCFVEQCFVGAEQSSHPMRFPAFHVDRAEPTRAILLKMYYADIPQVACRVM
ncbi:hypothetical protein [Tateyamaria pelophila]|uniref:hypothetical protein n=1 Tax=Tateyamaria pelophila TaxID=328415 RepID=UPI001CC0694B|nr:hypothetical protein [Tateyamaria pelophila]